MEINQFQNGSLQHFFDVSTIKKSTLEKILNRACDFLNDDGSLNKTNDFCNNTVCNVFFENSTRTRTTFELAAKNIGAITVNLDIGTSSSSKGESMIDTIANLEAMKIDVLIIRHNISQIMQFMAQNTKNISIVNAGDGKYSHPTQAMLDLFTIQKQKGNIEKLKIAIVGDVMHSRVARSNIALLTKFGCQDIRLIAPKTLLPVRIKDFYEQVTLFSNLEEGVKDADVIIILRIQQERMQAGLITSLDEFFDSFAIKEETLNLASKDAIVMHPGPINREVEIASKVADGDKSFILQQVNHGVAVRMAVLATILENKVK